MHFLRWQPFRYVVVNIFCLLLLRWSSGNTLRARRSLVSLVQSWWGMTPSYFLFLLLQNQGPYCVLLVHFSEVWIFFSIYVWQLCSLVKNILYGEKMQTAICKLIESKLILASQLHLVSPVCLYSFRYTAPYSPSTMCTLSLSFSQSNKWCRWWKLRGIIPWETRGITKHWPQ